jgi:hypothetical protein
MLSHSELGQFLGSCLSHTSRCKATHGDVIAILNQGCCLSSRQTCISHNLVKFANLRAKLRKVESKTKDFILFFAETE